MEWLEQNIDAYRIVSEILGQLRIAVREGLERAYADDWFREGLPQEVFDRLVAAKEREKSIDWYEGQYQQIMDYATFPDLIQILEKNSDLFPAFVGLAPSPALLHARFLELDVMRAKLGRARPISETELSFLGTFHLRFRKAVAEANAEGPDDAPPKVHEVPRSESPGDDEKVPPTSAKQKGPGRDEPTRPQRPASISAPDEADEKKKKRKKKAASEEDDIPTKEISSSDADRTAAGEDLDDGDDDRDAEDQEATGSDLEEEASPREAPATVTTKISDALEDNNHVEILRHLYREVTRIAEGVWSNETTPAPLIWEQVTASDWYERNFSRLGLQPLSAFYDVAAKIEARTRDGIDKKQLQELLKDSNFARTLLQLRDMFQANDI